MTITPVRADRQADWDSGRAFRTLPRGDGVRMARYMAALDDAVVQVALVPHSTANADLARQWECGHQFTADMARSVLWSRGLLDELVFPR